MPAAQTQMNVRMNADMKRRGDSVLAEFGFTPSAAVRALWSYVAERGAVPSFMKGAVRAVGAADRPAGHDDEKATLSQLAEEGAGMAIRLGNQAGLSCASLQEVSYETLRGFAFDEYCRDRGWDDLLIDGAEPENAHV